MGNVAGIGVSDKSGKLSMSDAYMKDMREFMQIDTRPKSDWSLCLDTTSSLYRSTVTWRPLKSEEPNAFQRLMYRLLLGLKWEKTK